MMRRLAIFMITFVSVLSFSLATFVPTTSAAVDPSCRRSFLGLPVWYKYLDVGTDTLTGETCEIIGPLSTDDSSALAGIDWQRASGYIALAAVEILLTLASIVAVGFVIYGGFKFITSQGDSEGAKNARQAIINALIGLVIALVSTGVVRFVAGSLTAS